MSQCQNEKKSLTFCTDLCDGVPLKVCTKCKRKKNLRDHLLKINEELTVVAF